MDQPTENSRGSGSPGFPARGLGLVAAGRGRPLGGVLLALLIALQAWPDAPAHRALRLALFDQYQSLFPRSRVSAPAVIVDIDEASLARHGQWPWPRAQLGKLVELLAAARPAAIGVDIIMPEPDRLSSARFIEATPGLDPDVARRLSGLQTQDSLLAAALRGKPVVLGVAGFSGADASRSPVLAPPFRVTGGDPLPFLRRFAGALQSLDEINRAAAGHGLLSADTEGGVVRRVPLAAALGNVLIPALGLEMLRVAGGIPAVGLRVEPAGIAGVAVGDLFVPTQSDAGVWVYFSPHDPARFVSAASVLGGSADPRQFEGKLVLIGLTGLGLVDYPTTPLGERVPGIEIHAQLLEDIFDGTLPRRPAWTRWTELFLLAAGGALLVFLVPAARPRVSFAVATVLVATLLALGVALFRQGAILLDTMSPALGIGLVFGAMLAVTLAEADRQRRRLRQELQAEREAAARLAGELEAARRIQMGILPSPEASFPGEQRFELSAFLEPARLVGGDLYDFFMLGRDRLFFLIGDVSGKGLPASLFMAVSKALYKSTALREPPDLGAIMREADAEISRDNPEMLFVTVFAGILDTRSGELQYCNAGHDAPWMRVPDRDGVARLADGGGPPLCVIEGFAYAPAAHRMIPGETLCLVTDGVTEAQNPGRELYGHSRLTALLARLPQDAAPGRVVEVIREDVGAFAAGAEPADDVTILVLRWRGPAA